MSHAVADPPSDATPRAAMVAIAAMTLALAACAGSGPSGYTEPVTGMAFVRVPAGAFVMGLPDTAGVRPAPRHQVRITRPFLLGAHEVTQGEWAAVMDSNPSHFASCGADCPVERVNWFEVREFIARLSERTGLPLRLPTEAEWEYACRAGRDTPAGDALTPEQANYDGHAGLRENEPAAPSRGSTMPVGSFPPNAWGLYDMHGNVWEWTADDFCPYATSAVSDPVQRCPSGLKSIRGGSWYFSARAARCGNRYTHDPVDRGFSLGFRLALDSVPEHARSSSLPAENR